MRWLGWILAGISLCLIMAAAIAFFAGREPVNRASIVAIKDPAPPIEPTTDEQPATGEAEDVPDLPQPLRLESVPILPPPEPDVVQPLDIHSELSRSARAAMDSIPDIPAIPPAKESQSKEAKSASVEQRPRALHYGPAKPKPHAPELIINRTKEDEPARAAREVLDRACKMLAAQKKSRWRKYPGDWKATEIRGNQAKAAFSHKDLPDCDVTLRYDELRQQWKVISVSGGGFPACSFPPGFFR